MGNYIVYIIKSINDKYYIGQTNNLNDRLKRHNSNRNNFTKGKGPWNVIISYETETRSEAVRIELYLKKLKNSQLAIKYLKNLTMKHN